MRRLSIAILFTVAALPAIAATSPRDVTARETYGVASAERPGKAKDVELRQNLDALIPLDLVFTDEQGRKVPLRKFFGDKPVVLTPVYYECPMLCNMVLDGLVTSMRDLRFDAGKEFEIVTFSFDPSETPAQAMKKKNVFVKRYGRQGAAEGWHFLTGDEASVKALTDAIGFTAAFDDKTGQFAHAANILVLTPEGRIARYLFGIEYKPRDLRLAIVEAGQNKIGTLADQLLLLCYHYDPATGKYSAAAMNFVRAGGVATVAGLAGFMFVMLRREKLRGVSGRNDKDEDS